MVKKSKKDKKKSKKKQISPEEEKDLLVTLLATKCNMEKEDVEKSYDDFNLKYKDGFIQKDEYIQSMKVTNVSIIIFISLNCFLQNTMMAESLFRVFDEDKSGTLSFEEYLQVCYRGWVKTGE